VSAFRRTPRSTQAAPLRSSTSPMSSGMRTRRRPAAALLTSITSPWKAPRISGRPIPASSASEGFSRASRCARSRLRSRASDSSERGVVKVADAEADRDPVSQLAPRDVMRDAVRLERRRCLRFRELLSGDRRLDGVLVHRSDLLAEEIAIAMRSR
jgi:hypothetical protein